MASVIDPATWEAVGTLVVSIVGAAVILGATYALSVRVKDFVTRKME